MFKGVDGPVRRDRSPSDLARVLEAWAEDAKRGLDRFVLFRFHVQD